MANGIGGVSGYGNYGVGGYVPANGEENITKDEQEQPVVNNYEETQVDPERVMEFLSANNFFIAPANQTAGEVDPETQDRVAGYMEQFEMIYGVITEEFGEEAAPAVMDAVMDYLMGLAA